MKHLLCVGILLTNFFCQPVPQNNFPPKIEPVIPQVTIEEQVDIPVSYGEDIQEIITEVAEEYGIAPSLMLALAEIESTGNPNAVSSSGDYGLMQINKFNHKWLTEELGITDWFDARQSAEAACFIIDYLGECYDECQEVSQCLMAYNMGENNARPLWKQGIYESEYSKKVLDKEAEISRAMDGRSE